MMKKLINAPADLTSELLEGYCLAYPNKVKLVNEKIIQLLTLTEKYQDPGDLIHVIAGQIPNLPLA